MILFLVPLRFPNLSATTCFRAEVIARIPKKKIPDNEYLFDDDFNKEIFLQIVHFKGQDDFCHILRQYIFFLINTKYYLFPGILLNKTFSFYPKNCFYNRFGFYPDNSITKWNY